MSLSAGPTTPTNPLAVPIPANDVRDQVRELAALIIVDEVEQAALDYRFDEFADCEENVAVAAALIEQLAAKADLLLIPDLETVSGEELRAFVACVVAEHKAFSAFTEWAAMQDALNLQ